MSFIIISPCQSQYFISQSVGKSSWYQFPADDDDGVDDDDRDGEGGENDEGDHPDITDGHGHW